MRQEVRHFLAGAFGLIGLFLVLQHYTGFAKDVGSLGAATTSTFKTLQGR
jgi:hypothetical protein